ncbi:hypothetical protein Q9L58_009632 [Maublancomyces gigas]|uniref:Uncharacterized protein n=1 Tax=Discina gigas TaxID=1032678 RepID=A0ABR3G6U6_9PEZI
MRKPCVGLDAQSDPGKGVNENLKPIFRSEDFRSTLSIGWIPENGRQILLLKKGKTTQFIDNLLFDAQQWSNFRALLQIHVRRARDLQQDFEEKRYLCAELETNLKDGEKNQRNRKNRKRSAAGLAIEKLSRGITRMELEVESEIKKLDEKIKDMIELEFNLVSIYEARTSKIMGMSMKRLSWITFIFLPLMFVAVMTPVLR